MPRRVGSSAMASMGGSSANGLVGRSPPRTASGRSVRSVGRLTASPGSASRIRHREACSVDGVPSMGRGSPDERTPSRECRADAASSPRDATTPSARHPGRSAAPRTASRDWRCLAPRRAASPGAVLEPRLPRLPRPAAADRRRSAAAHSARGSQLHARRRARSTRGTRTTDIHDGPHPPAARSANATPYTTHQQAVHAGPRWLDHRSGRGGRSRGRIVPARDAEFVTVS